MSWALLAAVLSLLFAGVVLQRFAASKRPAFAAWGAGLLIFAAASAVQAMGEVSGFSVLEFRLFYLLGGVLGVIYLALGTLYLLAPRPVAKWSAIALVAVTVVVTIASFAAPVNEMKLSSASGVMGDAWVDQWNLARIGAIVFNIIGTLVLVGGSGWSAWRLVRAGSGADRVICNVLLTIGAFIIAAGFSAAKVTGGHLDVLGMYEAIGIAVMFAGFLSLGRVGVAFRLRRAAA